MKDSRQAIATRPESRRHPVWRKATAVLLVCGMGMTGCREDALPPDRSPATEVPASEEPPAAASPPTSATKSLFDARTLKGWRVTDSAGHGEVRVEEENLVLGFGEALTSVTYTGEIPRSNYELRLEAKRVDGADFFCGLTFPVGDASCTLIVGGWGGSVVGLSNVDGEDASQNETTRYESFDTGRWYPIRLKVTEDRIQAWIDETQVVDLKRAGRQFSLRPEIVDSHPLAIASWQTTAALRKIKLKSLEIPEKPAPN